jgi:hypothetical protein
MNAHLVNGLGMLAWLVLAYLSAKLILRPGTEGQFIAWGLFLLGLGLAIIDICKGIIGVPA